MLAQGGGASASVQYCWSTCSTYLRDIMTQVHSDTAIGMSEEFLSYDDLRRVHTEVWEEVDDLRRVHTEVWEEVTESWEENIKLPNRIWIRFTKSMVPSPVKYSANSCSILAPFSKICLLCSPVALGCTDLKRRENYHYQPSLIFV